MTCRVHVWEAESVSTLNLWAHCVNCGHARWNPYRIGVAS